LSRVTAAVLADTPKVNLLKLAVAQQATESDLPQPRDSNTPSKFVRKPFPEHGVSILGDMSRGHFRSFVPLNFRKTIFDSIHSLSHPGIKRSTDLISDRYDWPAMKSDIKKTCIPCQQS